MRDIDPDPETESTYECFTCGSVLVAVDPPGECPDCGGQLRNRGTPIE